METIAAREGKNNFGDLVDQARTQQILVERKGP